MKFISMCFFAAACFGNSMAAAENFGDKVARCMVQQKRTPGYDAKISLAHCEKIAQSERDVELANRSGSTGPNMKQLKPALLLHFCVEQEARSQMALATPRKFRHGSEAESYVWNGVLDKCFSILTSDEAQAMIYQNYQGNNQRMIDFRDGLLWAERADVFSAVMDWYTK